MYEVIIFLLGAGCGAASMRWVMKRVYDEVWDAVTDVIIEAIPAIPAESRVAVVAALVKARTGTLA